MAIPAIAPYPMPTASDLPKKQVDWVADPARCALLLHDVQAYFLAPYDHGSALYTELLANLVALRRRAAELGVPVVYSAQPGGMTPRQRGLLHDFWGPGMSAAASDTAIVEELRPAEGDLVVTKWRYSAFVRSPLREFLAETGRDQLIVGGVYAHVGCLMTCVDAYSSDIRPFLAADAVADFGAEDHHLALDYAARCCAAVHTTAQLLDQLAVPSAGETP
ncbi:isochorismatase family protein [Streptomyces fumanus]|uniref:Isochorismatase-like domain-containing protein n=1 Tax=Streptomyces fumanus TaxID=67302 RepID=A0A919ACQ2_9ACTN|nr:isochorismatase family protein [Streptomyces fumanus]GHE98098.1 hypothetical protein GCM10018772_23120 [Streptomyces fumanus]